MSTSKHFHRICCVATVAALLITVLLMNGTALGISARAAAMEYEEKLFDTSTVHTIDIRIDDWDAFLATAQSEEYAVCDVVIDRELFTSVGIRGKGNTSLSTVASMDSDRYSFKIEFDQYDSAKSYYGLDKLSLNNLIQDNTMMKDYLTYRMMSEFGVAAPLCSYAYITVNGEDWGLYLAVEAVEESFLQRNYGNGSGDLYKPDSTDMGGGRGNGKDFSFEDFTDASRDGSMPTQPSGGQMMSGGNTGEQSMMPENLDPSQMEGIMPGGNAGEQPALPENLDPSQMEGIMPGGNAGEQPALPENLDPSQMEGMMPGGSAGEQPALPENFDPSQMEGMISGDMGMGSDDTKLQYIDDQASSYSAIFDNAKTDVTAADQQRLIESLKALSAGENLESVVAVEDVIRYFVVHNYVVNADSYTGSMVHNYYLYEKNGQLSMIPWDYNLAFGTFQGGDASAMVSDEIDSPLSVTGSDRPMIDWIFSSEAYTQLYHTFFQEFLDTVDPASIIAGTQALIAPYVERDPTKFCTYEEFEKGVQTLTTFCALRSQSIADQLAGGDGKVDASSLTLSDMGTMNHGDSGSAESAQRFPETGGLGSRENWSSGENGFQNEDTASAGVRNSTSWILLGATVLIGLCGLLVVLKYKR